MPAPLSEALPGLSAAIRAGRRVLLFTDFDGTLVPIHEMPFDCFPLPGVRESLAALAARPGAVAAVVSGRELDDLIPRVGVTGLSYAGNHGLEIIAPGVAFAEPGAVERQAELAAIAAELAAAVADAPGAWVQDKGLSASVHYRLTPPAHVPAVAAAVERVLAPHLGRFVLRTGKMVFEVRPRVDWHKGRAVQWLRNRFAGGDPTAVPIFLGDDATDEDAFAVLPDGITVLVGPAQPTAARYRVDAPADAAAFLAWLAERLTS